MTATSHPPAPVSPDTGSGAQISSAPLPTMASALGEIVWLFSNSIAHRHLFIADLEWMVMPPLLLGQFRLFRANDRPAGLALWAHLSDEVEARLQSGIGKLKPEEWKSGPHLWLVELIAPLGGAEEMLADLQANIFGDASFKLHRTGPDGVRRVEVMGGLAPDGGWAR
ncbi:MAG: toxin-activating lysine-acyltransferase [Alphaproteobacteria bacterium]